VRGDAWQEAREADLQREVGSQAHARNEKKGQVNEEGNQLQKVVIDEESNAAQKSRVGLREDAWSKDRELSE